MTTTELTPLGEICISRRAIATVASLAAVASYGVVGMAAHRMIDTWISPIARDPRQGIEVAIESEGLILDVFVILEYGLRITSVARSMADAIQYQVQRTFGLQVRAVHIHVQGLRVSSPD
jgi:uncharacterized alkaline shock family protein YloU